MVLALCLAGAVFGGVVTAGVVLIQPPVTAEIRVASPISAGAAPSAVESVAAELSPSVGTVINLGSNGTAGSLGSGFVFSSDGRVSFLITNNHVVQGASAVDVVMPDGHYFKASIVGTDTLDDLAVISVPDPSLPVATFGTSSTLVVGQSVIAIGSPLGNVGSVTSGVISAVHRTITAGDTGETSEQLEDVLQTDASINPGNSGGPLANTSGDVVGVNVAVAGNSNNIGFSIPADLARRVAEALIAHQRVQHPFIGIEYLDAVDAAEAGKGFDSPGVLVTSVSTGGPAAAAGFQTGDILTAVGGVVIDDGQTLGGLIQDKTDGERVTFTVMRGTQTLTLTATLEERPGNLPNP